MIIWAGPLALFLIYEGYALYTKEEKVPTLSRTIWKLTAWQVSIMIRDRTFTARPLRWIVFGIMAWATIHLAFGECAFGLCL